MLVHDGAIKVKSEPGKGSSFEMTLPVSKGLHGNRFFQYDVFKLRADAFFGD